MLIESETPISGDPLTRRCGNRLHGVLQICTSVVGQVEQRVERLSQLSYNCCASIAKMLHDSLRRDRSGVLWLST